MDAYKKLESEIQTFRDNTAKIAEQLALSSELGSTENLSSEQFSDNICTLTTQTSDLGKSIVDHLTELLLREYQAPSLTTRLLRSVMTQDQGEPLLQRLEIEFKASFEIFQLLQRQVMERKRVEITSRRSSVAESAIPNETDEITPVIQPNHTVVDEVTGQQLQIGGGEKFRLGLVLEKKEEIQNLEEKAILLHYIEKGLAERINDQGDIIDTVERNVCEIEQVVAKTNNVLQRATKTIASRTKCLCFVIILVAILVLAIIVNIVI